jgi:hypothetical protein
VTVSSPAVNGQDRSPLREGETIRIQTPRLNTIEGTLVRILPDSLILDISSGGFTGILSETVRFDSGRLAIPMTEIESVDVMRCCKSARRGAVRGARLGVAIGLGLGVAGTVVGCVSGDLDCSGGSGIESRAVKFTLMRMGTGALIGAILGSFMPPGRWVTDLNGPFTLGIAFDAEHVQIGLVLGGSR